MERGEEREEFLQHAQQLSFDSQGEKDWVDLESQRLLHAAPFSIAGNALAVTTKQQQKKNMRTMPVGHTRKINW